MTARRKWIVFGAAALAPLLAGLVVQSYTAWWRYSLPFAVAFALEVLLVVLVSVGFLAVYSWCIRSTVKVFVSSAVDFVVSGMLFAVATLTFEPRLRSVLGQLGMEHLWAVLFLFAAANIAASGLRARMWRRGHPIDDVAQER